MPINDNPSIFNLNKDNQSDKKLNQPLNKETSCDNTHTQLSLEEISRLTASLVYMLQKENIELKQKINILSKSK